MLNVFITCYSLQTFFNHCLDHIQGSLQDYRRRSRN